IAAVRLTHLGGAGAGHPTGILAIDREEALDLARRALDLGQRALLLVQPLERLRELADEVRVERRQALRQQLSEALRIELLGELGPAELEQQMAQRREALGAEVE